LVRVLEDWLPPYEGYFLYYPGHRQVPTALRALIDMIRTGRRSAKSKAAIENPLSEMIKQIDKAHPARRGAVPTTSRNGT
jgi:hypothetical protein